MSGPAGGMAPPVAGRYRLTRRLGDQHSETWEAVDDVLSRTVVLRRIPGVSRADLAPAARLNHPHLVATFEAGEDEHGGYVVSERIQGQSLEDLVRQDGPLPPARACRYTAEVVDALRHAHRHGVVHGRLTPAAVLITDPSVTGRAEARLSGCGLDAEGSIEDDVRDAGAVLYFALTASPPDELAASPRRIQPGISKSLASLVESCLAGRYPDADALARAIDDLDLHDDDAIPVVEPNPTPPHPQRAVGARRPRRWGPPLAVLLLVAAGLAAVGAAVGGRIGPPTGIRPPFAAVEPVALESVSTYDPLGDGDENGDTAPLAIDGDAATAWSSERYSNRDLGNLKPGVGLVVHINSTAAVPLASLEVLTDEPGWRAEVYVARDVPQGLGGWGAAAAVLEPETNQVSALLDRDGTVVLLWFTRLAPSRTARVAEVTIRG